MPICLLEFTATTAVCFHPSCSSFRRHCWTQFRTLFRSASHGAPLQPPRKPLSRLPHIILHGQGSFADTGSRITREPRYQRPANRAICLTSRSYCSQQTTLLASLTSDLIRDEQAFHSCQSPCLAEHREENIPRKNHVQRPGVRSGGCYLVQQSRRISPDNPRWCRTRLLSTSALSAPPQSGLHDSQDLPSDQDGGAQSESSGRLKATTNSCFPSRNQHHDTKGTLVKVFPIRKIIPEPQNEWRTDLARLKAFQLSEYENHKALFPACFDEFGAFIPDFHILCKEQRIEGSIAAAWYALPLTSRYKHWRIALLCALRWSMADSNRITMSILETGLKVPSYAVADTIDYITKRCRAGTSPREPFPLSKAILVTTHKYLELQYARKELPILSKSSLSLLFTTCPIDELFSLFMRLQRKGVSIGPSNKLLVLERLATAGRLGASLETMQGIPREYWSLRRLQSSCIALLRKEWPVQNLYTVRTSLLAHLLDLGIRPRRRLYNVILLNAIEAGDHDTAWNLHRISQENNLAANQYTYSLLLHIAQKDGKLESINEIYKSALRDGVLRKDLVLATHLTRAVYQQRSSQGLKAFDAMLDVFQSLFKTEVLYVMGIIDQVRSGSNERSDKIGPDVPAVGTMVTAWLEEQKHDLVAVRRVYSKFVTGIRNRDPLIMPLARNTYIWNAFVTTFGQQQSTLHESATVVNQMMSLSGSSFKLDLYDASAFDDRSLSNIFVDRPLAPMTSLTGTEIAAPDQTTWNALLNAVLEHKQNPIADKILGLMQEHQIRPDRVTWNTLINSHAKAQNLDSVVKSVRLMERDEIEPDKFTQRALSRVIDKAALLKAFRKATLPVTGKARVGNPSTMDPLLLETPSSELYQVETSGPSLATK